MGRVDGVGSAALFKYPMGIAVHADNLFVSEGSHRIRKVVISTGEVTTYAGGTSGSPEAFGSANGLAAVATFYDPQAIAVDGTGLIVYVADSGNNRIRKIAA